MEVRDTHDGLVLLLLLLRRKRISSHHLLDQRHTARDVRIRSDRSIRPFDRCWNLFPDILSVGSWIFYEASNGRENILFLVPCLIPSSHDTPRQHRFLLAVEFPLFSRTLDFDSRQYVGMASYLLIHESLLDNFIVDKTFRFVSCII